MSNGLLFHNNLKLNEVFGSVNNELFACTSVISIGDFLQLCRRTCNYVSHLYEED